jgi:hypothetical protein
MRHPRGDRMLGPSRGPWTWTRMTVGAAILHETHRLIV